MCRNGTISVANYEFEEKENQFFFASCLTRPEAIFAIVKVRDECNKILKLTLLETHYTKSLSLEQFEQLQTTTIDQSATHLKER